MANVAKTNINHHFHLYKYIRRSYNHSTLSIIMLVISHPEKQSMSLLRQSPPSSPTTNASQDNDDTLPDPPTIPKIQLTKACNFFTILPCEIIREIFNYLPFTDSLRCLAACPLWYNFIVSNVMECVEVDSSLIHKSTVSKWPIVTISGPMTQDYYDIITGLLCSSFHSSLLLEAIGTTLDLIHI